MLKFFLVLMFFFPVISFAGNTTPAHEQIIKNFKATDAEKKQGAVVLYKDVFYEVNKDGRDKGYVDMAIAVLNEKAVNDYSQIEIGFDEFYTSIKLEHAKIIDESGSVKTVSADAYQVQKASKDQFYDNSKIIKFSLPGLKPDSIINYRYSFTALKPHFKNEWTNTHKFHYIQQIPHIDWIRLDPVRLSHLKIVLPSDMPLESLVHNFKDNKVYKKSGRKHSYSWTKKDLPSIKIENNMPSIFTLLPYINVSTINSWRKINQWAKGLADQSIIVTPEISKIASSFKTNNSSVENKVKAVFDYVQKNIRYVYAHVDSNGYTPHKASEVLSNKYGDCKDQSILIVTLLKAIGITAYPTLINSYTSRLDNSSLPALRFNHMIVHVPALEKNRWLDTSGDTGKFPGISPTLDKQYALILDGKKDKLEQLKYKNNNKVLYTVVFRNKGDSKFEADLSLVFTGVFDTYFRSWYKNSQDRKSELRSIIGDMLNASEITHTEIINGNNYNKPFTIKGKVELPKTEGKDEFAFASSATTLLNSFTSLKNLPIPGERIHPFVSRSTYQLSSRISFIRPDESYRASIMKSGANYNNEFFTLKHNFIKNNGDIAIGLDFVSKKKIIDINEYKKFYNSVNNAIKESESFVVYKKTSSPGKPVSPTSIDEDNIEQILAQARQSLDKADYDNAKRLAEKGLSIDSNNAEVYYILGLASGFLDDYESSEKFLKKAEDLGYQP